MLQYQQQFRNGQLHDNLYSGVNLLLATPDSSYSRESALGLFDSDQDSVSLQKVHWGIFDLGIARAFRQKDTLYKAFLIGNQLDSAKWAALYVEDQDRPISVSGTTRINGDAYLPKAGIQPAYVDNMGYSGNSAIVLGAKHQSAKQLPGLDLNVIARLATGFTLKGDSVIHGDSVSRSFLNPVKIYSFGKTVETLQHITLSGNIILCSDTTLVIDSTANLDHILVFAKVILVKGGFKGQCQLFASDSIAISKRARFLYLSCLGVVRTSNSKVVSAEKITLHENCFFNGILFTYEKTITDLKPLISLGKKDTLDGQVYSQGTLDLKNEVVVQGNVSTRTFLYRTPLTQYENYLINVTLDSRSLSPYYLSSGLLPGSSKKKKILQWLEGN